MTDALIAALRSLGVTVIDLRGKLQTHPTKVFGTRDPKVLTGLVAHHSAGPNGPPDRFREIAAYHVGPNHISPTGCPGICYSLGIAQGGEVCVFWDLDRATWSQGDSSQPGDENREWLAVLLVGNFRSKDNPGGGEPTLEQMRSYLSLALACRQTWGTSFQFSGHFAFGKPACPGATMETVVRAVAAGVVPSVKVGSVLQVQKALDLLDYLPTGEVDGVEGPVTRAAVSSFQKDNALAVDGKVGPKTWAVLVQKVKEKTGGPIPE